MEKPSILNKNIQCAMRQHSVTGHRFSIIIIESRQDQSALWETPQRQRSLILGPVHGSHHLSSPWTEALHMHTRMNYTDVNTQATYATRVFAS